MIAAFVLISFLVYKNRVTGALISGYCSRCDVIHSLPTTDEAKRAALDLRERMLESGRIDVDELQSKDGSFFPNDDLNMDLDPLLSIGRLYERRGKMFGVLVCEVPLPESDSHSEPSPSLEHDVVILKAFAGKLGGQWNLPGWAPILGRVPESLPVFRRHSAEVTEMFGKIDDANKSLNDVDEMADASLAEKKKLEIAEKVKRLTKERAALATLCLEEVRRNQLVPNFRGETYPITAIFSKGPTKLPGGVGDCAAPKLLAEAARLGLRPTGIAEIFVGATGGMSTTKGDAEFYDACEQRCQQIAGYMLCGLSDD